MYVAQIGRVNTKILMSVLEAVLVGLLMFRGTRACLSIVHYVGTVGGTTGTMAYKI